MSRRLALFDLDNTLLAGDSDHAWGEFLIEQGLAEAAAHREKNDGFYRDYLEGRLDIHAYVAFALAPVLDLPAGKREALHARFMEDRVRPMLLDKALELVARHNRAGDCCLIITATNDFITGPIAGLFAVNDLLATEAELIDGRLTGKITGVPCYREGKVEKLRQWLDRAGEGLSLADSIFYTDSGNDLPLLEQVSTPVAVDPDSGLEGIARDRGWQILSLRD